MWLQTDTSVFSKETRDDDDDDDEKHNRTARSVWHLACAAPELRALIVVKLERVRHDEVLHEHIFSSVFRPSLILTVSRNDCAQT